MDEMLTLIQIVYTVEDDEQPRNELHWILCGDDADEIGKHITTWYGDSNVIETRIIRIDPGDQKLLGAVWKLRENEGTLFEGMAVRP